MSSIYHRKDQFTNDIWGCLICSQYNNYFKHISQCLTGCWEIAEINHCQSTVIHICDIYKWDLLQEKTMVYSSQCIGEWHSQINKAWREGLILMKWRQTGNKNLKWCFWSIQTLSNYWTSLRESGIICTQCNKTK